MRNSLTVNIEPSYLILEYQICNELFVLGLDDEYLPSQINNLRQSVYDTAESINVHRSMRRSDHGKI